MGPLKIRKTFYYLRILRALIVNVRRPWKLFAPFLGREACIELRNGLRFVVDSAMDCLVLAETLLLDCYKVRELKKPGEVLDLGAASGDFTVFVKFLYPECKVIAFEPSTTSYEKLQRNLALNGMQGVETYNLAVGKPGTGNLSLSEYGHAGGTLKCAFGNTAAAEVRIVSLGQYIHGPIDLVKIDCEGAEVEILESIGENAFGKVRALALEYHEMFVPNQVRQIADILNKHGFKWAQVPDPYMEGLGYVFASR